MREIRMSGSMRGCRKRATLAARLRPTPQGAAALVPASALSDPERVQRSVIWSFERHWICRR
jgi:hypothetical protein